MSESNIEETRLEAAEAALGELLPSSAWRPVFSPSTAPRLLGEQLWSTEQAGDQIDDRPLYWRRLAMQKQLKTRNADSAEHLEFELASRGMLIDPYASDTSYRVLVTGFDPFHLDEHIEQGNPSGVVALAHHGRVIKVAGRKAEVRSMIFPVRYKDFDEFLVERVLATLPESMDMVITVSMGRTGFDLERFPGRRRSVNTPDNHRQQGGGSPQRPVAPPHLDGPEFVEFSLPVDAIRKGDGTFRVSDNRLVTTLEQGEFHAENLASLDSQTAVFGSGGGYLSNEISYRVLRYLQEKRSAALAGHIHTPRMQGYDRELVGKISDQCSDLIRRAVLTLV